MNRSRMAKLWYVIFALVFLAGCAVSESYKTGLELTKDNRWEDAIAWFERAMKEEPGNQEYIAAWQKAKQEAAKRRYEQAKSQLASSSETVPDLERVAKEAEAALKLDPANTEIKTFYDSLTTKIARMKETVKSLYNQADQDMQKEDWVSAFSKLKQVHKMYPNFEDTGSKLAKIEQDGAKLFYQQGVSLGKQEDWKMAAEAFKRAMELNPNYFDVSKQYELAKSRDNALYYISAGDNAFKAGNLDRAIFMYEKALEYQSDDQNLVKKIGELKLKAGKAYFEEAVKLVENGKYYLALKRIDKVKSYTPELQGDQSYKDFVKKFAAKLIERGDKYFERELWGNALIWYQYAESINPTQPELFQKLLDVKDNINKRIKKSIAVFDFGSPSNNKDAGKIAANKLISYLHKNASGDIRIIERENLQSILREMQLGQTGIVDVKSAQALGKVRGIDTFIMGDVLSYTAKTTDNPSTGQVKVLVDEEEEPNPEYQFWLLRHPKPSEEDLKNAPPRTKKRRNYQFISYRHGTAKISALIEISYKLVDTSTGENIFSNTIAGRLVKEDKYQDAVPAAGIPHDPLELPTELEVLDELTNQKISEMGQSVLKQFQSLEVEYFNQGEMQRLKRRNNELAIERYIDAVFDEKLKGISTAITAKSWEIIDKLIQNH
ncbi:MAG TPA: tetratricopeptide repeat protein [Syntrophales bacterium]|nr:tetratricopeptide repeat protein [Syntrophales bacterium]